MKKFIQFCLIFISIWLFPNTIHANNLTTIGDSISAGWLSNNENCTPYGYYTSQQLHMNFLSSARPSNMFVEHPSYTGNTFNHLIEDKKDNLKKSSIIIILEGTNDYGRNSSLKDVQNQMSIGLQKIKSINDDAYLLGIVPPNRWDKSNNIDGYHLKNSKEYTLKELNDVEKNIYTKFNVPYISLEDVNFSLTKDQTIDGLHPLPLAQKQMGLAIANYLSKHLFTDYKSYNKYVTITKKGYGIFQDKQFENKVFTTDKQYQKTFFAKGYYDLLNGKRYYSLYDKNDNWQGYVAEEATTLAKDNGNSPSGAAIKKEKYIKIKETDFELWQDFTSHTIRSMTTDKIGKMYLSKCYYNHINGQKYLSLYDQNDYWMGYLNDKAVEYQNDQFGEPIHFRKNVKITKKGYGIFQDKQFKKKVNTSDNLLNKIYFAKGYYYLFDGTRYYSLYDKNQTWIGYIRSTAIEVID